jgi:hypothetical protein
MEQLAQGISDGMYTYKHRCEGGVDIHDIVVKKSRFRILLYYVGTICLLMTVCRILLSKVFFLEIPLQAVAVTVNFQLALFQGPV